MKFLIFFAAILAVCSASGYYGAHLVGAPVTSVTSRLDTYGAKVIAAPVAHVAAYPVLTGAYYGHGYPAYNGLGYRYGGLYGGHY